MSLQKIQNNPTVSSLLGSGNERDNKYDRLLRKYKCRRKLTVYTTRLDDMNIVAKNLETHDTKEFIECIVKESMPVYNARRPVNTEPYVNKLMPYLMLKYKINMYNSLVQLKRDTRKRQRPKKQNRESHCDDEKTKYNFSGSVNILSTCNNDSSKTENTIVPNSSNSVDEFTVSNNYVSGKEYAIKKKRTKEKVSGEYPNKTYIIIEDDYSMETDIYYLNKNDEITQHYKSKDESYKDLKLYYDESNAMKLNHCCWYRKIFDILSNSTIGYIRKPHKCMPDNCKCCCKKYVTDISSQTQIKKEPFLNQTSKSSMALPEKSVSNALTLPVYELDNLFSPYGTVKIEELENPPYRESSLYSTSIGIFRKNRAMLQSLLTKPSAGPSTSPSLIKKAFDYSPLMKLSENFSPSNKSDFLRCVIIEISNSNTRIHEQYKIGADGEVEGYFVKHCENSETNSEDQTTLNNDGDYDKKIVADICCWYARNKFIDTLRAKKLLPGPLKFIKSSNEYREAYCTCRHLLQSTYTSNNSIDLSLPEHVFHTSDNVKKILNLETKFAVVTKHNSSMGKYVIENSSLVAKNINQNVKKLPSATCTTNFQKTPQSTSLLNPRVSASNTNVISKQESVVSNSGADSEEVKVLVDSILDKFKGIQLVVNAEGKISAQFNSNINHLNNEDIQMLIRILGQAQSELDALGPQNKSSYFGSCKPLGFPHFTANEPKPPENAVQEKVVIEKDGDIYASDRELVNTITNKKADDVPIVDFLFTTMSNNLNDIDLSTLMKKKRDHYLKAFECFLMVKQETLTPTIESVYSIASTRPSNIRITKRKTAHQKEGASKKFKTNTISTNLILGNTKNNRKDNTADKMSMSCVSDNQNLLVPNNYVGPLPILSANVDGLIEENNDPLQGTDKNLLDFGYLTHIIEVGNESSHTEKRDDEKNMPGPSKIIYIPQPVAIISSPVLQNLLKAPTSTMHSENRQATIVNVLPSNITNTLETTGFSKDHCSENTSVNIHDSLFKAETTEDDVILGV